MRTRALRLGCGLAVVQRFLLLAFAVFLGPPSVMGSRHRSRLATSPFKALRNRVGPLKKDPPGRGGRGRGELGSYELRSELEVELGSYEFK